MTSRKKRKPAALVRRADELLAPTIPAPVTGAVVAFQVPEVLSMLKDLKVVAAADLALMRKLAETGSVADPTGQKLRNLAATIATIQDTEREDTEDDELANLTPAQLKKRLLAEAAAIDGDEDDA